MKKLLLVPIVSCLLSCHSTQDKAYLSSISALPSFDMLLLDSTTLYHAQDIPSGKPIVMVYFRPDCPHCQLETKSLVSRIGDLQNFRIYFLTGADFDDAKSYAHYFHLDQYPNIIVGKDHEHSFTRVFQPSSIPFMVIYDSNKKLLKVYHGEVPIDNLIKVAHI